MSGPGMFPLAVRMVYQVYEAVRIPIVGMGGVTSAQDVLELMLAGATAVGVGAANPGRAVCLQAHHWKLCRTRWRASASTISGIS